MKSRIKEFVLGLGVDDVGFLASKDYHSDASPKLENLFPQVQSIIVMAFHELDTCDSPSPSMAMNGRLDLMEFSRSCNYKLARFLAKEYGARTMTAPVSYPMDLGDVQGTSGELSLRHAAVSAGLGKFGRHNLVIHPRFGTRVCFSAVLTDLPLATSDPVQDELCIHCDLCVKNCPAAALDQPGQTNVFKCLQKSQPYGIGGSIHFWTKFAAASPEEQRSMLRSETFRRIYQTQFIGFQYYCFNCHKSCPVGK